ncbi:Uma2 family endonuclease [Streptomyces sp. NPDC048254]|uniref:Uma2 family endonuclease n=1 Tax=Streptomyces sp. NPDC048254 TaxID=3365525 RepID=UPI003718EB18
MTIAPTARLLSSAGGDGAWIENVFAVAEREAPEDVTLELIEGEIYISGVPEGHHEHIASRINTQIARRSTVEMDISGHKGVQVPVGGGCPKDHVVPDLAVAPEDAELFRDAPGWMPPAGLELVCEITSGKPQIDREGKRRCYARAQIPLYLLVDRERETVSLFSDPEDGDYVARHTLPFGKPIALPEPLGFELDTSSF